jgi:hypothetical protein
MPDSPIRAKFLNEEDKLIAIERYSTRRFRGKHYGTLVLTMIQTSHEPARYRDSPVEMGSCERGLLGLEVMGLVCSDVFHLVREPETHYTANVAHTKQDP